MFGGGPSNIMLRNKPGYPSRIICRPIHAHTQTHIRNIDRERQRIFILWSLQEAYNESVTSHLFLSVCSSGFR